MFRKTRTGFFKRKLRGVSLLETLLALSIGGIVIASSVVGLRNYTEGVKVQASASMLDRLTAAADRYAEDNFEQLVARAPQELPISVLAPYYGNNIGSDAFRTQFRLSTRTYTYRATQPGGGSSNEQALQVLVVGNIDPNGPLQNDEIVRADVANTAGNGAGFVATDNLSCDDPGGPGTRPAGDICGAFGTYSFDDADFGATNFANVGYLSLITKGDSSVYGDQLYRYDFGDPELNTMRTDLHMDDNDIIDPQRIRGVNGIDFDGGAQNITTRSGQLNVSPAGNLNLQPATNRTILTSSGGGIPVLASNTNVLQIGDNSETVHIGAAYQRRLVGGGYGTRTEVVSQADITFDKAKGDELRVSEVNSLFKNNRDPLRLQNINNGEVIVGKRVRYNPGGGSGVYEIADGNVRAQHMQVQDITCADCGGSLANILPRWRHMGTYYVEDLVSQPRGTYVPYPACSGTRRRASTRPGTNEEHEFRDSVWDQRYTPKIIVIPKELGFNQATSIQVVYSFYAVRYGRGWMVYPRAEYNDGSRDGGAATALAATYCVFEGGDNTNPRSSPHYGLPQNNTPAWTRID